MVRKHIARHLDRVMKVAPIVSVGLLILTSSLNMVQVLSWRGHPYLIMVGSMMLFTVLVLVVAYLWTGPLGMVAALRGSQALHDPVQVYQLTPFERVLWLKAMIPQMRHQLSIKYDFNFELYIENLERWAELGYIPYDEYPEFLRKYYWSRGEEI